jgi:tetratricopeptide (TPR) repeat protein
MPSELEVAYVHHINTGVSEFQKKAFQAALTHFLKAFSLKPTAATALFNVGRTYDELKDSALALHFYEAAATLGHEDALYNLGLWYESSGQRELAVARLKAFLKVYRDKNDRYATDARDRLSRLCPGPRLVWNNPEKFSGKAG